MTANPLRPLGLQHPKPWLCIVSLLSACGGGSGGSSSSGVSCPGPEYCALTGTWTITVTPSPLLMGCPTGLDGAELKFSDPVGKVEDGVRAAGYAVSSSDLDLVSRAQLDEGMMDLILYENGLALFETGPFYWPAGDVTVDLQIDPLAPFGTWDADGFTYSWLYEVYQGDVIGVDNRSSNGLDDDDDGAIDEADEEDDDFVDTFDSPLCEGALQLTGARPALASTTAEGPAIFEGRLEALAGQGDALPLHIVLDADASLIRFHEAGGDKGLGRFPVAADGSFRGLFLSGTIEGRVYPNRVLAIVRLAADGHAPEGTTLEARRQ